MGGCARKNLLMFKKLCGPDGIKNVNLVTTFWEKTDPSEGELRVQDLSSKDEYWGSLVKKGVQIRRHYHNRESALKILEDYIPSPENGSREDTKLAIQTEMVDAGKGLEETAAGQMLQEEIETIREKMRKEIDELDEAMKEAMEQRDKQYLDELQEERVRQTEQLQLKETQIQNLKITMEQMHEEKIRSLEERLMKEQQENRRAWEEQQEENRRATEERDKKHQEEIAQLDQKFQDQYESQIDSLSQQLRQLKTKEANQGSYSSTPPSNYSPSYGFYDPNNPRGYWSTRSRGYQQTKPSKNNSTKPSWRNLLKPNWSKSTKPSSQNRTNPSSSNSTSSSRYNSVHQGRYTSVNQNPHNFRQDNQSPCSCARCSVEAPYSLVQNQRARFPTREYQPSIPQPSIPRLQSYGAPRFDPSRPYGAPTFPWRQQQYPY